MPPRMIPFELLQSLGVEAVIDYRVSRETWELIDRNQRPEIEADLKHRGVVDAVVVGLLPPEKHDQAVLSEMSPEELLAIAEAEAARP